MDVIGGVLLLAFAGALVWLGRPQTESVIAEGIRRWKAHGIVALLATTFVGLGLALTISGFVNALP